MKPELTDELKSRMSLEFNRYASRQAPPNDYPGVPDLHAGRYISPEFYDLEKAHMWRNCWLFAGHRDEIPAKGSYKLWKTAGSPVILVNQGADQIKAFYNTCAHRGGPVVREASGQVDRFVCLYHSWNYDFDGNLTFVPDEHEFPDLDKSCRGLKPIRCETWGNWIWINFNPEAEPLLTTLGPVVGEFEHYNPNQLKLVEKHQFVTAANWKVVMDAFQEVYHLKHIHPETVDVILNHRGGTMGLFCNGHSRMVVPNRRDKDAYETVPPRNRLEEQAGEIACNTSLSYNLFPNLVTPTGPDNFPFLLFWPLGINETLFEVWWFGDESNADPESAFWKDRIAMFDVILKEDIDNLPAIQASMESGGFDKVHLSYQERRIYNYHSQIDRTIGEALIPEEWKAPPVLDHLREE